MDGSTSPPTPPSTALDPSATDRVAGSSRTTVSPWSPNRVGSWAWPTSNWNSAGRPPDRETASQRRERESKLWARRTHPVKTLRLRSDDGGSV